MSVFKANCQKMKPSTILTFLPKNTAIGDTVVYECQPENISLNCFKLSFFESDNKINILKVIFLGRQSYEIITYQLDDVQLLKRLIFKVDFEVKMIEVHSSEMVSQIALNVFKSNRYKIFTSLLQNIYEQSRQEKISSFGFILDKLKSLYHVGLFNFLKSPQKYLEGFSYEGEIYLNLLQHQQRNIKKFIKKSSKNLDVSDTLRIVFIEESPQGTTAIESLDYDLTKCLLDNHQWFIFLKNEDSINSHFALILTHYSSASEEEKIWYVDHDESKLNSTNHHALKPDWNQELFISTNYISRACVIHRDVVSAFIKKMGSSVCQNTVSDELLIWWGLVQKQRIGHIPFILSRLKKTTCSDLTHQNLIKRYYQSKVYQTDNNPLVSLIIPTRDGLGILKQCISSIIKLSTYKHYEIIIVDNDSQQPATKAYLRRIQRLNNVTVISYPHPFNYSAINNFAVKQAKGEVIGLINNDIEVITPTWLEKMLQYVMREDVGCVGAKLLYPDMRIQHAGVICGVGNVAAHAHRFFDKNASGYLNRLNYAGEYSAVTAACLLVRKELYQQVGGLDETHLTVAYNDVDFCLKVRQLGYRNIYTPKAVLFHHESISRGKEDTPKKLKRYRSEVKYMWNKWGDVLNNDPMYNPNLTRTKEDFSLRDDF